MWITMLLQYGICTENDNSEVVVINTGWEFSQAGTELWQSAQVPGTVHQDLINHKQIPDPFYGINEQKIQWVENEDWEYRTAFTVTPEQLKRDDAQLVFEGLDTYADANRDFIRISSFLC